jgi:hypothetical protein
MSSVEPLQYLAKQHVIYCSVSAPFETLRAELRGDGMALAAAAQLFEHKLQPLAVDSECLPDQYIALVQNHCREHC